MNSQPMMPRKLTPVWRRELGREAERIHGWYLHRLANLTLTGINSELGSGSFKKKRNIILKRSTIHLNRKVATEDSWNEAALDRRSEWLGGRALELWPWSDPTPTPTPSTDKKLRWRIEGGAWRTESRAARMVLNVTGELLSRDPDNAKSLLGDRASADLQLASRYPPDTQVGKMTLRAVPGHDAYSIYPYASVDETVERCRKMGKRCGLEVEVDTTNPTEMAEDFWGHLKDRTGGLPGQTAKWRGRNQYTEPLTDAGERIGVALSDVSARVYVKDSFGGGTRRRPARMLELSRCIWEAMQDQELVGDMDKEALNGRTICARRQSDLYDRDGWSETAQWILDQVARLRTILEETPPARSVRA